MTDESQSTEREDSSSAVVVSLECTTSDAESTPRSARFPQLLAVVPQPEFSHANFKILVDVLRGFAPLTLPGNAPIPQRCIATKSGAFG